MNVGDEQFRAAGLRERLDAPRGFLERVFGACEVQCCADTPPFDD